MKCHLQQITAVFLMLTGTAWADDEREYDNDDTPRRARAERYDDDDSRYGRRPAWLPERQRHEVDRDAYRDSQFRRYRTYRPNFEYSEPYRQPRYFNGPYFDEPYGRGYDGYRPRYDYPRDRYFGDYEANREFVSGLYRSLLGREGAPSEIRYWLRYMERGMPRREVVRRFMDSPERLERTSPYAHRRAYEYGY